MMQSFTALSLAGRLRPTLSTGPDISTLSSAGWSAVAADAAFPIEYCVLCRIVILYNEFGRSQSVSFRPSSRRTPGRRVGSQHLMHRDFDAVGMAGADADEQVFHQPAIVFSS